MFILNGFNVSDRSVIRKREFQIHTTFDTILIKTNRSGYIKLFIKT